jgi:hypothetical protein
MNSFLDRDVGDQGIQGRQGRGKAVTSLGVQLAKVAILTPITTFFY